MGIKRIDIDAIVPHLSSDTIVLVPNNRLRDAVLHDYADKQSSHVFKTPAILGIDVWAREYWEKAASLGLTPFNMKQVISGAEELFIWIEIIENSLDSFPLLNPEETANQLSHAYQLMKQWQLHESTTNKLEAFTVIPDIAAFLDWARQFESICEQRQVISLVDCIVRIADELDEANYPSLPANMLLVNFFQPPPLYALLFERLRSHISVTDLQLRANSVVDHIEHHVFQNQRAEFLHIANWTKELVSTQPSSHIGILGELSDEQRNDLERTLATALNPNHVIEFCSSPTLFNSSHSTQSLLDEAVIHDVFLLFQLVNEEQDAEAFCRLLRSTYVLADSEEKWTRTLLERELRDRVTSRSRLQDISYYAAREDKPYHCPKLAAALLDLREHYRRMPKSARPDQWREFLIRVLEIFRWPGDKLTPHQRRATQRFLEALDQISTLTPVIGEIELPRLLTRLRNLCRRTKYRQQFDSKCQISLYTLNEATGLDFDHVWILNFNDQVWPPAVSPSPFLPYALQKEFNIPGSHTEVQFANAKNTLEILSGSISGSLQTSHHRSDGDQAFRQSSFAKSHTLVEHNSPNTDQALRSYSRQFDLKAKLELKPDDIAVPLISPPESLGGHRVLSDQSNCPFHAFIVHRLHAAPVENFATGLSRAARGTAMHEALEYLFKQIPNQQTLLDLNAEQRLSLSSQAAACAIEYLTRFHQSLMTPRFTKIETERLQNLILHFLELETTRETYSVLAAEKRHSWTYRDMVFNLKIDRIDQLGDGSLAVIDYKTGKSAATPSSWLKDRPQDVQLPFYLTVMRSLYESNISTVAIAHVNAERTDYSGAMESDQFHASLISIDEKTPGDMNWSQLSHHFEQKIKSLADEFHEGIAAVFPIDYSEQCNNYQVRALCRMPAHLVDATTEAVGE